jgi:hypothetical protein
VISTSVRGARGNARIDTTNKSASARIAEAKSGVDVKAKPRMNFATANSGATAADGTIEGRKRALRSGKESGCESDDVAARTIVRKALAL